MLVFLVEALWDDHSAAPARKYLALLFIDGFPVAMCLSGTGCWDCAHACVGSLAQSPQVESHSRGDEVSFLRQDTLRAAISSAKSAKVKFWSVKDQYSE